MFCDFLQLEGSGENQGLQNPHFNKQGAKSMYEKRTDAFVFTQRDLLRLL